MIISAATLTHLQFCPYIKPYTAFPGGESDADVLLGLDADVEVRAQCQAEGLQGRSVNVMLSVQPAPVCLQISCVTAVGASPWGHIHPNKENLFVKNNPCRAFNVSPRQDFISVCCQFDRELK